MSKPALRPSSDPLGRQLNVAARATRSLLDSVLADTGTTFASWTVLIALTARGPTIQRDLAKALDMIGPSIVERIDDLESAGLVVRSSIPEDRRASLITLTKKGQLLFAQLQGIMEATEAALLSGLADSDIHATRRCLAHIAERARTLRADRLKVIGSS
ncbi:MAG: MarR family winged helix-turn-helix transcriptional regulator [Acidimicrobiales bacterium]